MADIEGDPARRDRLLAALRERVAPREDIARRFGVDRRTLLDFARRHGLDPPSSPTEAERAARVARLWGS